jgi:hypothetical protein
MKPNHIFMALTLLTFVACGKDGGGNTGSNNGNDNDVTEMVAATPGTYYAVLRPITFHSNGFIPYGAATFVLKDDQLQVSTSLDDDQAVNHRQTLHMGTRCPTLADDTNGDTFLDYNEALSVVGPALMPLDNDLNSQAAGADIYPRGIGMTYNKSASLSKINADLWITDEDSSDNLTKLPTGTSIGFENRVVLVHGTSNQSTLPSSVAAYRGEASHLSLPVVCGVLGKIE